MQKIIFAISIIFIISLNGYSQDNTSDISKQSNSSVSSSSSSVNSASSSAAENSSATPVREKNGWDLYQEGRYVDSINALKKEKALYPGRINIYVILGWDFKILKNYSEMENISLEGLNISSDDTRIIYNLIEAYYFQNKYDKAIPWIEKFIASSYQNLDQYAGKIYYYLGVCFLNTKEYRKADIALSTAKYYSQNDADILLKLANVKEKLNDMQKAREYYSAVLSLAPSNQEAIDGLKRTGAQ